MMTRPVRAAVFVVLLAAHAGAQAPVPLSGTVWDPANREVAGAVVLLTDVRSRVVREVSTDTSGRFGLAEMPPGEYLLEVRKPGFEPYRRTLRLVQPIEQPIALELGALHETLTVAGTRGPAGAVTPAPLPGVRTMAPREIGECSPNEGVRAPRKLREVVPVYPPHLAADGIGGEVVLVGTIGTDGLVIGLRPEGEPHGELLDAAMTAVGQWVFEPTLLNCVPVEVPLRVGIRFDVR